MRDQAGQVLFEQTDITAPKDWSDLAVNVTASKYFHGEPSSPEREDSVLALIHRVVRTIADWGWQDGYFQAEEDVETFYRELAWLCLHQYMAFNSPVWFNCGLFQQYGVTGPMGGWVNRHDISDCPVRWSNSYEHPQCSACFIQSVDDTMDDIMRLAVSEAMLFKFGSGTGTDLSTIRSTREKLSGGGQPSGPLSFMRVYDSVASVVKSGGKTRRAAKMQSLKDWHPDILEFIQCKTKEESKARTLIESGKYESNFNGEAYSSVMFQNANLSVRLSNEFMEAVGNDQDWQTYWVTNPEQPGPLYRARDLLREIAQGTWYCGDPGVQFDTTINEWNTCPESDRINATNPCSEFSFLDETACNLASINLRKMQREDGSFDCERFRRAVELTIVAQEIIVDRASYPTEQIAKRSHEFRPLGIGYTNLGGLLMSMGIPYDSVKGRQLCGVITSLMTASAYATSAQLAAVKGSFEQFDINEEAMLGVIQMHMGGMERLFSAEFSQEAQDCWQTALDLGRQHGYRNAQISLLAPTGTIAFMMDCDTTGIEPDIALVKYKQLAGGGSMKIVNRTVPVALERLGYDVYAIENIVKWIEENDTIEGAKDLQEEDLPVFDCAFKAAGGERSIAWRAHVKMMAAAQPFLSGAISKTVNMPQDSTVEDIEQAYIMGWELDLKALAIYRDGSKLSQPLNTSSESEGSQPESSEPYRRRLPDTRQSITHKFDIAGHEGYFTVGMFEDGRPGELFITMSKEGSTIGGLMDVIGTETSLCLQYGVPLPVLVEKFSHVRFEPAGWTNNPDIRHAKSVVDYLFRWMGLQFLDAKPEVSVAPRPSGQTDAPACSNCGCVTYRNGSCYLCHNCGTTSGCS